MISTLESKLLCEQIPLYSLFIFNRSVVRMFLGKERSAKTGHKLKTINHNYKPWIIDYSIMNHGKSMTKASWKLKNGIFSRIFLHFTDIGYQLIANYVNIKAESFEIIEVREILSSPSPHQCVCYLDYFPQYLITFVKGDFPVRYLENKYEVLFFFLLRTVIF